MRKSGYKLTDEHKKAISQGMRKKFASMTPKDWELRTKKRIEKAALKNYLLEKYNNGLIIIK